MNRGYALADRLATDHRLAVADYQFLLDHMTDELAAHLQKLAVAAREEVYGRDVYIRGLIEITNICRNDCLYCGIRRSNQNCARYRLSDEEILSCCREGYTLGFRTFVLQGGEDGGREDERFVRLVGQMRREFPDCAITLSLGERSRESYRALFEAGADRYLLRHETADKAHYESLHPAGMSFERRMECLQDLKEIGYQVGCGFMVGSPGQTTAHLARDLQFVEEFSPAMCGIGPFIPHTDTPFADQPAGNLKLTCVLLSILRLIKPTLLLPATTALGSIHETGREQGILAGANVVMPNLSPPAVRGQYSLYNNKATDGSESAQCRAELERRMTAIGYRIVTARGDAKE